MHLQTATVIALYLVIAGTSAFLFQREEDATVSMGLSAGYLFTVGTLLTLKIFGIPLYARVVGRFLALMMVVHATLFLLTFYSGSMGLLTGPILTGIGAFAVFELVRRNILAIQFSPSKIAVISGLCFLSNNLLAMPPVIGATRLFYDIDRSIGSLYAGSLFLWQAVIGISLVVAIREKRMPAEAENDRSLSPRK